MSGQLSETARRGRETSRLETHCSGEAKMSVALAKRRTAKQRRGAAPQSRCIATVLPGADKRRNGLALFGDVKRRRAMAKRGFV